MARSPDDPALIRPFTEAAGEEVGKIDFGAGESVLFMEAAEEAVGVEFMPFLEAPVGEVDPDDTHVFGGMVRDDLTHAVEALDSFLAETPVTAGGVQALCDRCEMSPTRFFELLGRLRDLAHQALQLPGELITLYH